MNANAQSAVPPSAPDTTPYRLDRWARRMHHWHFWGPVLFLVLPFLLPLLVFLSPGLWAISGSEAPAATAEILAPDAAVKQEQAQTISRATEAERDRIATLALVLKPFPHSMPIETGVLPAEQGGSGGQAFRAFLTAFRASACVDGADQVNQRPEVAESELAGLQAMLLELRTGASGLDLMRNHYHNGLVEVCRGEFAAANRAFQSVGRVAEQAQVSGGAGEQLQFLGIAGERLALAQIARSEEMAFPELPALPPSLKMAEVGQCTANSGAVPCALFDWPELRTDLSRVHEYLATAAADPADFRLNIERGYDGGNLAAYNYAAFVAAWAKSGEYDKVTELVASAARQRQAWEAASGNVCKELDRMAVLGWIAGMQPAEISACDSSPYRNAFLSDDSTRFTAWEQIHTAREALIDGDITSVNAQLRTVGGAATDTEAFHERVRSELMARTGDFLWDRLEAVKLEGDETARSSILELLQSDSFSFRTRAWARIEAFWESPTFWLLLCGAVSLLLTAVGWAVRNLLIGYGFAFTSRHHDESMAKGNMR